MPFHDCWATKPMKRIPSEARDAVGGEDVKGLVDPCPRPVDDHRSRPDMAPRTPRTIAQPGLMKPPAGVISTQPTMIAVAAPTAVTFLPRIRSRIEPGEQGGMRGTGACW